MPFSAHDDLFNTYFTQLCDNVIISNNVESTINLLKVKWDCEKRSFSAIASSGSLKLSR